MTGAWFRHRRLPGRLGVVGVTRLLVFQVIQISLLVVLVQGIWAAILGGVVGALAIAVTLGRWRGRWWTETAMLWLRYRQRRGTTGPPAPPPPAVRGAPDGPAPAGQPPAGPQPGDPRLAALSALVSDLALENVPGAEPGTYWGMGSDGAGWFTVLEVDTLGTGVHPPVPLSALARVAADSQQAGVVLQVLTHRSRDHRALWVAVRLDAQSVADSMVDSLLQDPSSQLDVPAVLAELTRRVQTTLERRGLTARQLDAETVLDALVRSCDLGPVGAAPVPVREDWHAWHSGRLAHRCYWLKDWPDPERGTNLLASLLNLPEAQVSISLLLEPRSVDDEGMDLRCLVRIAAHPQRHREVGGYAEQIAERLGGQLFPLDGEHALAVYCSAPSGGGAR